MKKIIKNFKRFGNKHKGSSHCYDVEIKSEEDGLQYLKELNKISSSDVKNN